MGKASDPSMNVRVAVRARPMSRSKTARGSQACVTMKSNGQVEIEKPKGKDGPKTFTFDFAYNDHTEQTKLYEELGKPLVDKALEGFNGTIFAYGQTGSGKTWSMMGIPENAGLIPTLNQDLFDRITADTAKSTEEEKIEVRASER